MRKGPLETCHKAHLCTTIIPLKIVHFPCVADADAVEDCWDVCGPYLGRINQTSSGITCQSWRDQEPHGHYYQTDGWFPREGLDGAQNSCRDPETGWWKPWCFTVDPNIRWDICTIPLCNSMYRIRSLRNIKMLKPSKTQYI